jgi:antitoxin FitA
MRTLYLRNVPDEVACQLEALAARAGMSVTAYTVRELTELARRADNLALLEGLPDHDVDLDGMLDDLAAGRTGT